MNVPRCFQRSFSLGRLAITHMFRGPALVFLSGHPLKPRRGGLFIERRRVTPPFFLFFSGAGRRGIRCAGARSRRCLERCLQCKPAPLKNKKNSFEHVRTYKQATPTGFKSVFGNCVTPVAADVRRRRSVRFWREIRLLTSAATGGA